MTRPDGIKCAESVHNEGRWPGFHACGNPGKVRRNGKWYCGTHDPEKVGARRAAGERKWRAKLEFDQARNNQESSSSNLALEVERAEAWLVGHTESTAGGDDIVHALREYQTAKANVRAARSEYEATLTPRERGARLLRKD